MPVTCLAERLILFFLCLYEMISNVLPVSSAGVLLPFRSFCFFFAYERLYRKDGTRTRHSPLISRNFEHVLPARWKNISGSGSLIFLQKNNENLIIENSCVCLECLQIIINTRKLGEILLLFYQIMFFTSQLCCEW